MSLILVLSNKKFKWQEINLEQWKTIEEPFIVIYVILVFKIILIFNPIN